MMDAMRIDWRRIICSPLRRVLVYMFAKAPGKGRVVAEYSLSTALVLLSVVIVLHEQEL